MLKAGSNSSAQTVMALVAVATVVFSAGGAWVIVKYSADKIEHVVSLEQYDDLKNEIRFEVRALRNLLFNSEGQPIYVPSKAYEIERAALKLLASDVSTKLSVMNKTLADINTSIALIEQREALSKEGKKLE